MSEKIVIAIKTEKRLEFICPNCGEYLQIDIRGETKYVGGRLIDNAEEILVCPNRACGRTYNFDVIAYPSDQKPIKDQEVPL